MYHSVDAKIFTGKSALKIELLYFESCPHWQLTLSRLEQVLIKENMTQSINQIPVENEEMVRKLVFKGSPTVRINGKDIEDNEGEYGMTCRIYEGEGVPPESLIRNAILKYKEK